MTDNKKYRQTLSKNERLSLKKQIDEVKRDGVVFFKYPIRTLYSRAREQSNFSLCPEESL